MSMSRRTLLAAGAATAALTATKSTLAKALPKMATNVLDSHDALGLAELVRKRQVSPSELLEMSIARVEETNPRYNFMAQKLYDYGRKAIAAGLPDGPFRGVPWLLKDLNTHIKGERTGQGSRSYNEYVAGHTSELVKRHQAAGFVIFGKTTTPEFGLTGTTESIATGITRNPWDSEHIAGGSSGGAGAAVAAGVVPAAHATDGGGSIRIPASCCGLFGLKPSRGRVPMGPNRTEGWGGMSVHHALTRSVRDSAALLDATHGLELGSRYGAPAPNGSFLSQLQKSPDKLRIALMLTPPSGSPVDAECIAATQATARILESLGHHVEEARAKIDAEALGRASFAVISTSLAADIDDRAKITGIVPSPEIVENVTLMFYGIGKKTDGMSVARAHTVFQQTAYDLAVFMQDYDIILSPTVAAPPPKTGILGLSPEDIQKWSMQIGQFTPFASVFNMTGQPSMSLPLGMSASGLPIGVMMSGRYGAEATLLRLAGQVEKAAPWWNKMSLPLRSQPSSKQM